MSTRNRKTKTKHGHRRAAEGFSLKIGTHRVEREVLSEKKQRANDVVAEKQSRAQRKARVGKPQSFMLGNRTRTEKGRVGYGNVTNRLEPIFNWGDTASKPYFLPQFAGEAAKTHLTLLVRLFLNDNFDFYNREWRFMILLYLIETYHLNSHSVLATFKMQLLSIKNNKEYMTRAINNFGPAFLPKGFVTVQGKKEPIHQIPIKDGSLGRAQAKFFEKQGDNVVEAHLMLAARVGLQRSPLLTKQHHVVKSSLNGLNGEFTNSDDVDLDIEFPFQDLSDYELLEVYNSDYYTDFNVYLLWTVSVRVFNECSLAVKRDCRVVFLANYILNDVNWAVYLTQLTFCVYYHNSSFDDVLNGFFELTNLYPGDTAQILVKRDSSGSVRFYEYDPTIVEILYLTDKVVRGAIDEVCLHVARAKDYYGVVLCFLDVLFKDFFVIKSSLNGNNGEATNEDDHVRVSRAIEYQKKVSGGRNDPDDFSRRPVGNKQAAARRVATKPVKVQDEKPAPPPIEKLVYCTPFKQGWDGKQLYEYVYGTHLCKGCNNGVLVKRIDSAHQVLDNVVKSDIGWVERYTQPYPEVQTQTCFVISPWEEKVLPGDFTWEGNDFTEQVYDVFKPALNFLRQKFSTLVISESLVNGMQASLNREFGDRVDLNPTIQYYVHYAHHKNYELSTQFVVKNKPITKNRIEESYISSLGIERSEREVVRFNSVDCEIADEYKGRVDCCITYKDKKWSGSDPLSFDPVNPESYPKFDTSEADANSFKYYRSVFVRYDGKDIKPFVTYSVNAKNACKALKRMAGCRETQEYDHYLSSLQYSAYAEVLNRSGGVDEYLETHNAFFSYGRARVVTKNVSVAIGIRESVIDKFIVGPDNWANQNRNDGSNFKLSYLTPYLTRPSDYDLRPLINLDYRSPADPRFKNPGVWDLIDIRRCCSQPGELRSWVKDAVGPSVYTGCAAELNIVHQCMYDGFKLLREAHCRDSIDKYASRNPDWLYFEGYSKFLTMMDCESDRNFHAAIKHVKKALRMMYVQNQRFHTPVDIMVKTVNAKVKKEFAKFGKVPRLFVTYDAGCMFANELPEYSKVCLDGTYSFTEGDVTINVTIFAKPTTDKLRTLLAECITAMRKQNHLNILIYSDDSVWSGNINGVDFAFNVDISSCDSGNKMGTFGLVYDLLSRFRVDLAVGLMAQCAQTMSLVNPENKEEVMKIQMATYFEGSGTVLTTILNHVAMYMVSMAAVAIFGLRRHTVFNWTDVESMIKESGVCFGHVLTVEPCLDELNFCPEKIQFLKRSPLQTVKGDYVPCLNYGTIFRGFGSLEGDMVAEMVGLSVEEFRVLSWSERWDLFASRVVAGLVHEPSSLVLDALRSRFRSTPKHFDAWSGVDYGNDRIQYGGVIETGQVSGREDVIDPVSLARRYGCSVFDLEQLVSIINASKFGDVIPSEAVSCFACVDYGVKREQEV